MDICLYVRKSEFKYRGRAREMVPEKKGWSGHNIKSFWMSEKRMNGRMDVVAKIIEVSL